MKVAINDLGRHNARYRDEISNAIQQVLDSGWYTLGTQVSEFESEFAIYCNTKFALGVANGTDALELALRSVGVSEGDEVITVANAGFYSTTAINQINAKPVYADIDPESMLIDMHSIEKLITRDTRAIVVTHLYGRMAKVSEISSLATDCGLKLIEDCAQAHGAMVDGRRAGSWGDCAAFSFYPSKNLGALGDGGALVTSNREIIEVAQKLRQYGWSRKYQVELAGGSNSRLDEIQAAILRVKLKDLDLVNGQRRKIAKFLSDHIDNPLVSVPEVIDESYVAHLFVIKAVGRDSLSNHLTGLGVGCDIHYPLLDTQQIAMKNYNGDIQLGVSESVVQKILTLPCFPELERKELEYVCESVNSWKP